MIEKSWNFHTATTHYQKFSKENLLVFLSWFFAFFLHFLQSAFDEIRGYPMYRILLTYILELSALHYVVKYVFWHIAMQSRFQFQIWKPMGPFRILWLSFFFKKANLTFSPLNRHLGVKKDPKKGLMYSYQC